MPIHYEFDWDPAKAASNVAKHDVTFDEAMTVFADPFALSQPDDAVLREERWVTIGMAQTSRLLLVIHTHVEINAYRVYIRIISARKPTKSERRQYEQAPG